MYGEPHVSEVKFNVAETIKWCILCPTRLKLYLRNVQVTSGHNILYCVCGQVEQMNLLGELEKIQEETCILESQLVTYQKTYPQLPDMPNE
jgi:hypothetical protein